MNYKLLTPHHFGDYKLIDCGNGKKLEQFGKVKLIRPEHLATWKPQLSMDQWDSVAHAKFISDDGQKGKWDQMKDMPSTWRMNYRTSEMNLSFLLKLTSFKHVGLFPEQCVHWDFIYKQAKAFKSQKILNLFAYTGASSLAARAAGADVTHLEGVKQVVSWARQNMDLNKMDNIRWLIEDALKFVKREAKRGHKYAGVMLDPPSFGLGPGGERFILENQLPELIANVGKILDKKSFALCNSYSFKFSALSLHNLFAPYIDSRSKIELGELVSPFGDKLHLPHGVFFRAGI